MFNSMTDKVKKIREEVERLHNEYRNKKGALYFRKALRTVLFIIDSMQKEPVSEDLEEAYEQLAEKARIHKAKTISPFFSQTDYIQGVKDGANWQKEQMMAKAVDGVVTFDYYDSGNKTYGCVAHDSFCLEDFGLKDRDKVKVIVIKRIEYESKRSTKRQICLSQ